jgi:hypothetical protein
VERLRNAAIEKEKDKRNQWTSKKMNEETSVSILFFSSFARRVSQINGVLHEWEKKLCSLKNGLISGNFPHKYLERDHEEFSQEEKVMKKETIREQFRRLGQIDEF